MKSFLVRDPVRGETTEVSALDLSGAVNEYLEQELDHTGAHGNTFFLWAREPKGTAWHVYECSGQVVETFSVIAERGTQAVAQEVEP